MKAGDCLDNINKRRAKPLDIIIFEPFSRVNIWAYENFYIHEWANVITIRIETKNIKGPALAELGENNYTRYSSEEMKEIVSELNRELAIYETLMI